MCHSLLTIASLEGKVRSKQEVMFPCFLKPLIHPVEVLRWGLYLRLL